MSERHEHLDEGLIHAWLDGALSPDESARMESLVAVCEECGARVAEARGLIAASSRILSSLDAVPAGVIPRTSANGDQLAALRARRRATSRRWWLDRKIVVAASLVLVAGVARLAWQSPSAPVVEAPSAVADAMKATEPVVATDAPTTASPPAPLASQESARESKATPAEAAPRRIARAPDSVVDAKVADAVASAANELRRADSVVPAAGRARADSTMVAQSPRRLEVQQRQQALGGAQRQAQLGFSRDTAARPVAPPASFGDRSKLSPVVPSGSMALRAADAVAVSCFVLRTAAMVDTVRLLNQLLSVPGDPAWYRAIATGSLRDSTLAWRSVDATTLELRRQNGADSTALRFTTTGTLPEVRDVPGTGAVAASRITCPR